MNERSNSEIFGAEAEHFTRRHGTFTIRITHESSSPLIAEGIIVLTRGDVAHGEGILCRVASACATSTALDSAECDCSQQIGAALQHIAAEDRGVFIYLTDQEGRGHGLLTKIRALAEKNRGLDTFAAVEALDLKADVRTYEAVRPILEALGVESIVLLTNNPDKRQAIADTGVTVDDVRHLWVEPPKITQPSMRAKQNLGHAVPGRYADAPSLHYP